MKSHLKIFPNNFTMNNVISIFCIVYFAKVSVDVFGNHGLCGLLEEDTHEKSPKYLSGNLGDFGKFCKVLQMSLLHGNPILLTEKVV